MIEISGDVIDAIQDAIQALEDVEARPIYVMVSNQVSLKASFTGDWIPSTREKKVNEFLALNTTVTVERRAWSTGFAPDMIVKYDFNGVPVEIDFGSGVCEKKQVGTTKRMRYDPEALKNIPMVEIEEPVYTYLCDDPLAELV